MNVDSLRANQVDFRRCISPTIECIKRNPTAFQDSNAESAEVKAAKASATAVFLWWCAYSPYAWTALFGQFGGGHLITPIISMCPSFLLKTSNMFNPIIYATKHPK